jgi:hypothetical protein
VLFFKYNLYQIFVVYQSIAAAAEAVAVSTAVA